MKREKKSTMARKPRTEKVSEYKDLKKTPTAKVGTAAGPLQNGPIADPSYTSDAVNPNA